MIRRKDGLLSKIDNARVEGWIASLSDRPKDDFGKAFDEFADPGRKVLARLTDDELAELIARNPTIKQGLLAASIMRQRESWRSPAKYSLLAAGVAVVVSIISLARTF